MTSKKIEQSKKEYRSVMANKSVEEKYETLLKLQKITTAMAKKRGEPAQNPWPSAKPKAR